MSSLIGMILSSLWLYAIDQVVLQLHIVKLPSIYIYEIKPDNWCAEHFYTAIRWYFDPTPVHKQIKCNKLHTRSGSYSDQITVGASIPSSSIVEFLVRDIMILQNIRIHYFESFCLHI